jgi:S-adenosylmethionine:tRNA ribosyltransferase-isomerase
VLTAADFDYHLPEERIADHPLARRDAARLLVIEEQGLLHRHIAELPAIVSAKVGPGTLIVVNDTRVLPARLRGHKLRDDSEAGGRLELLLIERLAAAPQLRYLAMYRASKPLRSGQSVQLLARRDGDPGQIVTVVESRPGGEVVIDFGDIDETTFSALLLRLGEVPLPPYIERARERLGHRPDSEEDRRRYQTVYARDAGSVAAPTAGLHFTDELLAALRTAGHAIANITLHVGPGTFLPLRSDSLEAHVMHPETYHVPDETAAAIAASRAAGRKVLAVGTTVVRTLEAATEEGARAPRPGWGETRLFIRPPYRFRAIDALLTNFHLPRSTLIMLVAAFAGRQRLLSAYAAAVDDAYRFYSFGDAMLIPRELFDSDENLDPRPPE